MNNFVAHAQKERANYFQVDFISAYPESELRFGGHGSRSGHGRVDKTTPTAPCFGCHLLRERWIDRATVDPKRVWPEMIQKSIVTEDRSFDRVRMSQHC